MYVKIKKIYNDNDKCVWCTQYTTLKHITLTYECVFLYTRVFKKTKSTRQKRQEILQRRQRYISI